MGSPGKRTTEPDAGFRRAAAAAVCLLALVCGAGCSRPDPVDQSAGSAAKPDILLVTVDTLRADRLSAYGYERATTPFIDGIAAEGVLFERAYATSSWTVPSLVSVLTANYPSRHGMGEGGGKKGDQWHVIPGDLPSLPEILRDAGYRTYGFTANFGLPGERGFARGFDRYRCLGAVDIDVIEREIEPWLPDLSADGPWFFWLHLFDPHAPYSGRQPWLGRLYPELDLASDDPPEVAVAAVENADRAAEVIELAKALYDSEVAYLDDYLRQFFERVPRARDAFLLLTGDHGEEFLEHGDVLHGRSLFDETTRVPFILRFPDRRAAGSTVAAPVSQVDVLPTILAVAGIEPPEAVAGSSLVGLRGVEAPANRAVFAELQRGNLLRAGTDGRWKYVLPYADPQAEGLLFDLETDPGEQTDLSGDRPELVADFRKLLADFARSNAAPETELEETPMTREQIEALRDLGYVQ